MNALKIRAKTESIFTLFLLKLLKRVSKLSQHRLTRSEARFLQEALSADYKTTNIRLREGEYQYDLAKAIASFQLELYFPDVKDITKRLFGEEKTNDIQFIRKVQTILKKMEKSSIVSILPKKNPWELQRYALSSFKFQDVDKNTVILATEEQKKEAHGMLDAALIQNEASESGLSGIDARIQVAVLALIIVVSYAAGIWALVQPVINPIVFVFALSVGVACSVLLGKALAR